MKSSRYVAPKTLLKAETTLGAGNCAFNAFILGLCRPEILSGIEIELSRHKLTPDIVFHDFIERASQALQTEKNWAAVRDKMLSLRRENKVLLQQRLAQIMRDIAMERAEIDREHFERTRHSMMAAFHDFAYKFLSIETGRTKDDIYTEHTFIKRKFQELADKIPDALFSSPESDFDRDEYNQLKKPGSLLPVQRERLKHLELQLDFALGPIQHELQQWWETTPELSSAMPGSNLSGYKKFLEGMQQDGQWAGDLELAELARYFSVNLDVSRPDYAAPHHMHIDQGEIPVVSREYDYSLNAADISQLVSRGIVNKPLDEEHPESLQLLPQDQSSVKASLEAVPELGKVIEFIQTYKDGESLKKVLVPDEWGEACKAQLLKRNVINKVHYETGLPGYEFVVSHADAVKRIGAVAHKEKIFLAWEQAHKESPTITLTNPYALHWENMLPEKELSLAQDHSLPGQEFYQQTLTRLATGEIKPDQEKWELLLQKAEEEDRQSSSAQPVVEQTVTYKLPPERGLKSVKVTVTLQKDLDEELAKKLQAEEYAELLKSQKALKEDEALARRLQEEEDRAARSQLKKHQ